MMPRYEDLELRADDPIIPSAEYVEAYDAGWQDRSHFEHHRLVLGFLLGFVVALILTALATSRAEADPSVARPVTPTVRVMGPSDPPLLGAPLSATGGAPRPPAVGAGTVSAPAVISGPATWYDAPTARDAAAGPALRKALGRSWRDTTVEVCAGSRCIEVVLSDFCRCPAGHLIDLDDVAFSRLAPLSVGIIRVTITVAGAHRPTPPPTDVVLPWPPARSAAHRHLERAMRR
jgi:hypothetical protein